MIKSIYFISYDNPIIPNESYLIIDMNKKGVINLLENGRCWWDTKEKDLNMHRKLSIKLYECD